MVRWQVISVCSLGVALAVLVLLNACGGGGISLSPGRSNGYQDAGVISAPESPDEAADTPPATATARTTLTLAMPALGQMGPGGSFDVTLSASVVGELYQGSMRIGFDPAVVQPVSSRTGGLVPSHMVRLTGLDQPDHVPFAFTALPGGTGITDTSGELVTVTFRLLAPVTDGSPLWLVNDASYLQLRDRNGQRIGYNLRTSAEVR